LKKKYSEKCDIWSIGVILYILLCGYPPFNGQNDKQIIESVLKGHYTVDEPEWDEVSADGKDFVKKMLAYDPAKRISASDALQHKWIKEKAVAEKVS
jgi:calcium-dependent protein kinase